MKVVKKPEQNYLVRFLHGNEELHIWVLAADVREAVKKAKRLIFVEVEGPDDAT